MSSRTRNRLWLLVKSLLAVIIIVGVTRHFANILSRPELAGVQFSVHWEWLPIAGVLYLLAHCSWGMFWVRLLWEQGVVVSWAAGLRAYFVSQFGKYLPGKVAVIVIRVAMLGRAGTRLAVGVTATYETLTNMAAGALLGVLFLPYLGVLPGVISENMAFLAGIAALPIGLILLNLLADRIARKARRPDAPPLPRPSHGLLAQGLLHGAVGWCLLAVSLGLVIHAVVPDAPGLDGPTYLGNLAAVSLAYVLGFIVLIAPGGLGIREYFLQVVLTPRFVPSADATIAAGQAVIVALVLRLVWTVAELLLAVVLYLRTPRVVAPMLQPDPEKEP